MPRGRPSSSTSRPATPTPTFSSTSRGPGPDQGRIMGSDLDRSQAISVLDSCIVSGGPFYLYPGTTCSSPTPQRGRRIRRVLPAALVQRSALLKMLASDYSRSSAVCQARPSPRTLRPGCLLQSTDCEGWSLMTSPSQDPRLLSSVTAAKAADIEARLTQHIETHPPAAPALVYGTTQTTSPSRLTGPTPGPARPGSPPRRSSAGARAAARAAAARPGAARAGAGASTPASRLTR